MRNGRKKAQGLESGGVSEAQSEAAAKLDLAELRLGKRDLETQCLEAATAVGRSRLTARQVTAVLTGQALHAGGYEFASESSLENEGGQKSSQQRTYREVKLMNQDGLVKMVEKCVLPWTCGFSCVAASFFVPKSVRTGAKLVWHFGVTLREWQGYQCHWLQIW